MRSRKDMRKESRREMKWHGKRRQGKKTARREKATCGKKCGEICKR
jgi:hypothetical protein